MVYSKYSLHLFVGKGFVTHKKVKISDRKERRFGDIVTSFSSSNAVHLNTFELENGVTTSPKRRSFPPPIFTC